MSDPLDRLEVQPAVKGTGLEPEEAPARRVQELPLEISLAPALPDVEMRHGRPALNFPGAIPIVKKAMPVTSEMTAGEVAQLLRERCARCVNFRNDLWQSTKRVWEGAPLENSRRLGLTKMVVQLARTTCETTPTELDYARANRDLEGWGVCSALSEERKDLVIVHPEACCPDGIDYYRDRDLPMKREASAAFDSIMRLAQGKR